ncbi:MAG: glycosyltransferase [Paenibacillus sp.]|uniref:glycosyltransferase n=1 Tax=Paenibacillus sp. TaxID=58172 RepID=UPI0028FE7933|nr:glycosyltransferase [Paenibacillus sp.]MDU2240723.1 glycosyltransferase [Paenibacillus sp.]
MKIAYLIHWNEGPESGVFKKIISQALSWQALGHETALFLFSRENAAAWMEAETGGLPVFREVYRGRLGRTPRFKALIGQVRAWQPDVVYHRFDLYYPSLPRLLREYPSVLEINTNDVAELALEGRGLSLRRMYHLLTRRLVLEAAGGFVFVSGELARADGFRRYAKSYVVIGNGIPLEQFSAGRVAEAEAFGRVVGPGEVRTVHVSAAADLPAAAGARSDESHVRFVFISSPGQAWQGLDEIARLAAVKPDWRFDIIGPERGELEAAGLQVPANMAFHGQLTRDRYQPLLDRADLAIGTLALYRKGMEEASPLKVREYLANGLPVIAAYRETDFPEPVPFFLELPGEPESVVRHLSAIESFARDWRGRRVDREHVRHLDVTVKEAARAAYMLRIARRRERGGESG